MSSDQGYRGVETFTRYNWTAIVKECPSGPSGWCSYILFLVLAPPSMIRLYKNMALKMLPCPE